MSGVLTEPLPTEVADSAPSVRLAYIALADADHPLLAADVAARTAIGEDNVRRSLSELVDAGAVERQDHPTDSRRVEFVVAETGGVRD